jgi:RNase P subunit RPR2
MTDKHCEKCKEPLNISHLFDILMDKIEKDCHAFDVFKCKSCEHLTYIPVKHKPTFFQ